MHKYNKNTTLIAITSAVILIGIGILIYFLVANKTSLNNSSNNNTEKLIAQFGDHKLYESDFEKQVDLYFFTKGIIEQYNSLILEEKSQYLNQTIIRTLTYDDAINHGYNASYAEVERSLQSFLNETRMIHDHYKITTIITLDQLKAKIQKKSFDYNTFLNYLKEEITIAKYFNDTILSKKFKVDDNATLLYYNTHKDSFVIEGTIRASHILVNSSDLAKEIIKKLDNGADFAKMVKKYSIGPNAKNGGSWGTIQKDSSDLGIFPNIKKMDDAAFALKNIGDYTKEPVKTEFGYHIIKLINKTKGHNMTYTEAKDKVKKILAMQEEDEKYDAINNYEDNLLKKTNVKTFLDNLFPSLKKTDKPEVSLYVMSYSPHAAQIERGIIPVIEALKDKIDFKVKFCAYFTNGEKELKENTMQYCIQKEQKDKYLNYLKCFLVAPHCYFDAANSDSCLKKASIDENKLNKCMKKTDSKFKITEGFNDKSTYVNVPYLYYNIYYDKSTYKNASYPAYNVYKGKNTKCGVEGFPTLVINGAKVNSRILSSKSLAKLICSSFKNKPSECNNEFNATIPFPRLNNNFSC